MPNKRKIKYCNSQLFKVILTLPLLSTCTLLLFKFTSHNKEPSRNKITCGPLFGYFLMVYVPKLNDTRHVIRHSCLIILLMAHAFKYVVK